MREVVVELVHRSGSIRAAAAKIGAATSTVHAWYHGTAIPCRIAAQAIEAARVRECSSLNTTSKAAGSARPA